LTGEGDSGDICRVRADWRGVGCQQGFHVTHSAQHHEVPDERPANGHLVLCHGRSFGLEILPQTTVVVVMQTQ